MSNEVKVSSISIEIGKNTIDLSIEDARKLNEVLNNIFGKTTEVKIIEKETYKDYWYKPYIMWQSNDTDKKIYPDYQITCDANNSKMLLNLNNS